MLSRLTSMLSVASGVTSNRPAAGLTLGTLILISQAPKESIVVMQHEEVRNRYVIITGNMNRLLKRRQIMAKIGVYS